MLPAPRLFLAVRLALASCLLAAPLAAQERGNRSAEPAKEGTAPAPSAAPAVSVAVAPATVGPVAVEVVSNGVAEAPLVISVRARVDGQVERVHVAEGHTVKRGAGACSRSTRAPPRPCSPSRKPTWPATAPNSRAPAPTPAATRPSVPTPTPPRSGPSRRGRRHRPGRHREGRRGDRRPDAALASTSRPSGRRRPGRLGSLPFKAGNFVRASEGAVLATITQTDPILVPSPCPSAGWRSCAPPRRRGEAARVRARAPGDTGPPGPRGAGLRGQRRGHRHRYDPLKARFPNEPSRLWPGQYLEVVMVPRIDAQATSVPVAAVRVGQGGSFLLRGDAREHGPPRPR